MHDDDDSFWRLQRWRTIADEAIEKARERGEFDDLPGHGEPLSLRPNPNPFAGDRELALHLLANADVLPPWMESDREMAAEQATLDRLLDEVRAERQASSDTGSVPEDFPRWEEIGAFPFRLGRAGAWPRFHPRFVPRRSQRARLRRRVLAQTAVLDAAISRRNDSLPADLRFLARPRYGRERAEREFGEAWPEEG